MGEPPVDLFEGWDPPPLSNADRAMLDANRMLNVTHPGPPPARPSLLPDTAYTATCDHQEEHVTYKEGGSGRRWWRQCVQCGAGSALTKAQVSDEEMAQAGPFDEELRNRTWQQRNAERQALQDTAQREASRAWWNWYNTYLRSEEWAERRRKVFERAGGLCEGCREVPATQVHHLTYEHVGYERLWELVAICHGCHEFVTRSRGQAT